MKVGALTARFASEKLSLAQIIDWAGKARMDCLEIYVPHHLNPDDMLQKGPREEVLHMLRAANVTVSSLAYYRMQIASPDAAVRKTEVEGLIKTIDAAEAMGVGVVCTLAGTPMPEKSKMDTIKQDLPQIFGPVLDHARKKGIKIALENYFRTNIQHLEHWKALFEVLPHDNFGLNFDPSHLDKMEIDYLSAVTEFGKRIFHTHAKDVFVDHALRRRIGVLDCGDSRFCIPGTGRIDWGQYIGRLRQVGYNGVLSIEHEDGTLSAVDGFKIGAEHLRRFIA